MPYEYILVKTDKKFVEVFDCEKNSISEFDESLGTTGHERYGLNIGDGQYYSFGDLKKLTIDLIRNEGHADLFDPSWTYYVTLRRKEFEEGKYRSLKEKIKGTLDLIGITKITTEFD